MINWFNISGPVKTFCHSIKCHTSLLSLIHSQWNIIHVLTKMTCGPSSSPMSSATQPSLLLRYWSLSSSLNQSAGMLLHSSSSSAVTVKREIQFTGLVYGIHSSVLCLQLVVEVLESLVLSQPVLHSSSSAAVTGISEFMKVNRRFMKVSTSSTLFYERICNK